MCLGLHCIFAGRQNHWILSLVQSLPSVKVSTCKEEGGWTPPLLCSRHVTGHSCNTHSAQCKQEALVCWHQSMVDTQWSCIAVLQKVWRNRRHALHNELPTTLLSGNFTDIFRAARALPSEERQVTDFIKVLYYRFSLLSSPSNSLFVLLMVSAFAYVYP